jgi:hypothetical protein
MKMKNKFVICSVLIILLTACIVSTGCTSTQGVQSSTQSNSTTVQTPSNSVSPTTVPETLITTLAATTAPTVTVSTTGIPTNDILTLTLNSAEKKVSLGNGIGKPGRILLLIDITIKNNDKKNDFQYTDASFVISYKSNNDSVTAITSQYALNKGLSNPLLGGTIKAGSTDDGKILFGVNATSNSYKLSVVDPTGRVLTSIDNIYVP